MVLIALVGFQLRSVMVGVAPVLPELRSDLHLSFSAVGALTAIPVLGLGAAALPGAILVSRHGARKMVAIGTVGLGVAALLRLTPPLPYSLFAWTSVLSLSIAVAQPAVAVLVRNWFPAHVQQVSTLYALALGVGAMAGGALTEYLVQFGGWRTTFVIWGLAALAAGAAWIRGAPGRDAPHTPVPHQLGRLIRERQAWGVAGLFGTQSLVFYGGITWIPFLLRGRGGGYLALVMFLFQAVSLPMTAALALLSRPWARSRSWYVAAGVLMAAGAVALTFGEAGLAWLWASLLGLGSGMILAGATALPVMLATGAAEVAGRTALMLTAGYALAFFGPLLGGVLLDDTHVITSPFWVVTAAAVGSIYLGARLPKALPSTAAEA